MHLHLLHINFCEYFLVASLLFWIFIFMEIHVSSARASRPFKICIITVFKIIIQRVHLAREKKKQLQSRKIQQSSADGRQPTAKRQKRMFVRSLHLICSCSHQNECARDGILWIFKIAICVTDAHVWRWHDASNTLTALIHNQNAMCLLCFRFPSFVYCVFVEPWRNPCTSHGRNSLCSCHTKSSYGRVRQVQRIKIIENEVFDFSHNVHCTLPRNL